MSSSSILLNNSEPFLDWIAMCNEKWVVYDNWRWPVQCGWTEKKLQSSSQSWTCTQKWSWSLFGSLLPVWSTAAFWIPVKRLHVRNMLSKLMRCTQNCNICSWHQSTERAQFFPMTMPDHTSHYQRFKSWTNWAIKCCLIRRIHLSPCKPTATSSTISTTFSRENGSTTRRRQKMLPKHLSNSEA